MLSILHILLLAVNGRIQRVVIGVRIGLTVCVVFSGIRVVSQELVSRSWIR